MSLSSAYSPWNPFAYGIEGPVTRTREGFLIGDLSRARIPDGTFTAA